MNERNLFFLVLIFVSMRSIALPAERLILNTDMTYASEYVIDGFNVGDHSPVMQLTLKMNIPKTEYSLMYWNALQINRKKKADDEHDLFILYRHDFLTDSKYTFNIHGFYDYWFYPNTLAAKDAFDDSISTTERHGSKLSSGISFPKLIPLADSYLIPTYNIYYWIYWANDRKDQYQGGTHHEILLEYSHLIPRFIKGAQSQYVGASASLNYMDQAFKVKTGWSHSTAGFYTGVKAMDTYLTISLNQQWSYEPSVNPNDELWSTLSLSKEF